MSSSSLLGLRVVPPDGLGAAVAILVDRRATGLELKERLRYVAKALPEDQVLRWSPPPPGGSPGASPAEISDEATLEVQGVVDGAQVLVQQLRPLPESALRESLARHGQLSYCRTARADPRFASVGGGGGSVPEAGGAPRRLAEAPGGSSAVTEIDVAGHSWADDGKTVKVYVDAIQDARAVAAAGRSRVRADFRERGFSLTIEEDVRRFVLRVPSLHREVVPQQCKFRVSEGQRITVSLKKADQDFKWFSLTGTSAATNMEHTRLAGV